MATMQDIFLARLKEHGQSRTRARQIVFDGLLQHQEHPIAMRELVEQSKGVDRASVYRAVELFERLAIVQRIYTGWKYKLELSDSFTAHHHHLVCTHCGKSVAINENELENFIDSLAMRHGFVAQSHQIEIQGRCAACQLNTKR